MKKIWYPVAALTLLELSACGQSKPVARDHSEGTAKPFDVSGVTLGMDLPHVEAQLRQEGYLVRTWGTQRSWADAVGQALAAAGGRTFRPKLDAPQYVTATKQGERVDVELRASPDGGSAWGVSYSAPAAGRSADEMQSVLMHRYGPPSMPTSDESYWCSAGEVSCFAQVRRKDYLTASTSPGLAIKLFSGADRQRDYARSLDAAVKAGSPKSHASF